MVIDSHNHLGGPDKGDGRGQSAKEIIYAMDEAGVDMAVVFPFNEADPGVSFSRLNDFIAGAAWSYPDRLIGFCRLDPNFGGWAVKELERCVTELGLKGVKLHPTSQGFPLDYPALSDILDAAQSLGVPALFDTGKELSPPAKVAELALRYPGVKFIMAHMNLYDESIAAARLAPNIYIGTTGYFNRRRLAEAVRALGAHRFLMGSDSPYISMAREVEKISKLDGVSDEERRMVLGGNFRAVVRP